MGARLDQLEHCYKFYITWTKANFLKTRRLIIRRLGNAYYNFLSVARGRKSLYRNIYYGLETRETLDRNQQTD